MADLRAVLPGEKVSAPRSVSDAAANGSTRELLVAMRNRIAKAVEDERTPARDLASLTKRLGDVAKDIEAIDVRTAQESESRSDGVEDGTFDASAV